MSFTFLKNYLGPFKFYCLCLLALLLAGYMGFKSGNVYFDFQQQEIASLEQTIETLNSENNALVKRINILGVELEVERLANQKAQNNLTESMKQIAAVRKELSFYQKVMAPELNQDGFSIDSLNIESTSSEDYYRLALVLMQQDKRKRYIKGEVSMKLKGSQDGKPAILDLVSLMHPGEKVIPFSFKFFEVLEGEFRLPKGFIPELVEVSSRVQQSRNNHADLQRSFDWELYSNEASL